MCRLATAIDKKKESLDFKLIRIRFPRSEVKEQNDEKIL